MKNPDGTKTDAEGYTILNAQITDYTFHIDEIYKGTYDQDTVTVHISNGHGLTPDLILNGEDENSILGTPLDLFELEIGRECILTLHEATDVPGKSGGYYIRGREQGYFIKDENGNFVNSNGDSLDPATIVQEIAAVMEAT